MRHRPTLILALTLACAFPTAVARAQALPDAAHEPRRTATAVRTDASIRIDGLLDEAAWAAAPVVDGFTQIDPEEGAPSTQRTEVRVLYDDEALYIGARLHDTGQIIGRLGRRDRGLGDSDWFGVMLDSYHDHRTAFGFDVNPAGVRRDEIKVIESDDNSWDPVWDVATSVDEAGWTAEYRIPFSQLRFSEEEEQVWGVQFERLIGRLREYSVSTFIPKSAQGGVPGYGHLEGLRRLEAGRRLEALPYVVARTEHIDHGSNPYRSDSEQALSAGLDLKYRVSSNLTLDATLNPDFGQVEVDPAVINLGVYETQFDEKRPFFIEGSEIFDLNTGGGGQLFYTRRIGRTPQVSPPTQLADVPAATTILGAAKLTGRSAGGWSLGVLEALTAEETGRFRSEGADARMVAEPLTNYVVARARRDLRRGSSAIGGLFSATNRDLSGDAASILRSAGYTGAVDFRHEWDGRRWALRGAVALSHVRGSVEAITLTQQLSNHYFQRPDADHLELDPDASSLTGGSAYLSLRRQAGEHWTGNLTVAAISPGYEVNDLGFNYRTDRRDIELFLRYQQNRPGRVWRTWSIDGDARFEGNGDDQLIANWLTLSAFTRTLGYWDFYGQISHSLRANDDRLTRGGPIAIRPAGTSAFFQLSSDGRKPLLLSTTLSGSRNEFDGWDGRAGVSLRWRGSSGWNLSLGPSWTRRSVVAQYVGTLPGGGDPEVAGIYDTYYLFAPLDYTEVGLETRLNMPFSPTLSLEVYAQPLLSSGDYGDVTYLDRPASYDFAPYAGDAPDRDFNIRSLRGNAVLRWEWRRGSTLYLAWQQSREGSERIGDFDLGRDRRALFDARPDDIFVVKLNYWLNP